VKKRGWSNASAVALALCVTLALAGCENFGNGPISIQRSGSHVVFAVCAEIDVISVSGEYSSTPQSKDFVTFIDEQGDSPLAFQATWNTGDGVPNLKPKVLMDPPVKPNTSIDVVLNASNPKDGFDGVFTVPPKGLSSTKWLHPDGTQTTAPCTGIS
jgi:hypothetical protein